MKQLLLLSLFLLMSSAHAGGIKFITDGDNPISSLTPEQIRDFYLKKNKQWPNGNSVRFFDRDDESDERKIFLREVLKRSQREVETFWIGQKLYTGHSAPTQVNSDSLMAALVNKIPGSLGYVSESFTTPKGIKIIELKGH